MKSHVFGNSPILQRSKTQTYYSTEKASTLCALTIRCKIHLYGSSSINCKADRRLLQALWSIGARQMLHSREAVSKHLITAWKSFPVHICEIKECMCNLKDTNISSLKNMNFALSTVFMLNCVTECWVSGMQCSQDGSR